MIQKVIANTNIKGQIVIPKKFRTIVGIDENVPLELILQERVIQIKVADYYIVNQNLSLLEIAKQTQGAFEDKENNIKMNNKTQVEKKSSLENKNKPW